MQPIKSLVELSDFVKQSGKIIKIAVACGEDANTVGALAKAANEGFVNPFLIGNKTNIDKVIINEELNANLFNIIEIDDETKATLKAVEMVRSGEADVLMKGLVNTDKFLKAVLDKEKGLLPPKAVMSYVCAIDLPAYHKLLFVSDTAVIPYPNLDQKKAMINYSVAMAKRFGIKKPKVALIGASEKVSSNIPNSVEYSVLCKMAERGQIKDCIIDGPLDIFLACDPSSINIKGVDTPIGGDADILIFPTLEACNSFYKALMLFAGGELAGLIQGTSKPVVVMSRSESALSKYYCVALSCLMSK